MRLSKNFRLEEFLLSQTAERNGIDMTPPDDIIENIQALVDSCLQPLRDDVNATISISSGYRPPALNEMIGGSATSAHMFGRAADFTVARMSPFDICELVEALRLPYDQVIHEFGRWTHLGIADTLREQELTAYRKDGQTHYTHGIIRMEDL